MGEVILPQTDNTNIIFIFFTDEVVYAGEKPYEYFGFEVDDSVDPPVPLEMTDLPSEIEGETQPNLCMFMFCFYCTWSTYSNLCFHFVLLFKFTLYFYQIDKNIPKLYWFCYVSFLCDKL